MQQLLNVFMTDTVNRYGTRFAPEALIQALWEEHDSGLPMLMSHDLLRAIGWTRPFGVYFEPDLTCLVGLASLAETVEESRQLGQAVQAHIVKMARLYEAEIEQLKSLLSDYFNGDEKILAVKECLAIVENGLCERVFPHIFEEADADGLIPLDKLSPIGPGVYKFGEFAVFAHHFLRRSLSRMNTLNVPFLKRLQEASFDKSAIKIAIDRDMVGLASTYKEYEELEFWWGPKFSDDLVSIPRGVSHHAATEVERMFHGVSGTQFWWQSRDNQHIFETEELRDIPSDFGGINKYGCRYVHSIVDETTGRVFHFDGAIRAYSEEAMIERLEVDLARAGRHTEYTKLWRLDGDIPVSLWKSLLSDYYRDNILVGEYLGAESEISDISSEQEAPGVTSLATLVPYSLNAGDGIRVALSFHSYDEPTTGESTVIPLDVLLVGEDKYNYIEAWTVELSKAIARCGGSLDVPCDALLISYKDSYINLPLILHSKRDTPKSVQQTLAGVRLLVEAFNRRQHDLVLSYTIGVPIADKEVRVSVLGHVTDLCKWFASPLCIPPMNERELESWGSKVTDYLKGTFPCANNSPPIFEVLMTSGMLLMKRQRLDDRFEFRYEKTDQGIRCGLRVPEEEQDLEKAMMSGHIAPAMAFVKVASECTHCGQQYRDCDCSKMLDDGVAEKITKMEFLPAFWTDRPVQLIIDI